MMMRSTDLQYLIKSVGFPRPRISLTDFAMYYYSVIPKRPKSDIKIGVQGSTVLIKSGLLRLEVCTETIGTKGKSRSKFLTGTPIQRHRPDVIL